MKPEFIYIQKSNTIITKVYDNEEEASSFNADLSDCYKAVHEDDYEKIKSKNENLISVVLKEYKKHAGYCECHICNFVEKDGLDK